MAMAQLPKKKTLKKQQKTNKAERSYVWKELVRSCKEIGMSCEQLSNALGDRKG